MLRRRLLTRVGLLISAFVVGAAGAIWAMQVVLADIDRANADAAFLIDGIQLVATAANGVEASASLSPDSSASPARAGASQAEELSRAVERLGAHPLTAAGAAAAAPYERVRRVLPRFLASWSTPIEAAGAPPRAVPGDPAHAVSFEMQASIQDLARAFRAYVATEQAHVGKTFRAMVLALTLAALVMVNVAAIVLLRTAQLVLRPVSALVAGSRELAHERFEHRVIVPERDEFAELARAYNHLAEQLQASEGRKAETLRQLAVTLNHGLNNAMGIIELQLGLLDRQSGGNPAQGKHLREIRASLSQMSQMVASLKNIRRVVLTDYGPGQKMVDLERSVGDELSPVSNEPFHAKPA